MRRLVTTAGLLLVAGTAHASYWRFPSLPEKVADAACVAVVDANGSVLRVLKGSLRAHIDVPKAGCNGEPRLAFLFTQRTICDGDPCLAFVPGDPIESRCMGGDTERAIARIVESLPPWKPSASGFDVIAVPNAFVVQTGRPLSISFGYRNRTPGTLIVEILYRGGVSWSVIARNEGGEIVIDRRPRPDPPADLKTELETINKAFHVEPGQTMFWGTGAPLTFAAPGRYTIEVTAHRLNGTDAAAAPFSIEVTSSPVAPTPSTSDVVIPPRTKKSPST